MYTCIGPISALCLAVGGGALSSTHHALGSNIVTLIKSQLVVHSARLHSCPSDQRVENIRVPRVPTNVPYANQISLICSDQLSNSKFVRQNPVNSAVDPSGTPWAERGAAHVVVGPDNHTGVACTRRHRCPHHRRRALHRDTGAPSNHHRRKSQA